MAFIAVAEIRSRVLRPLIRLRQQHFPRIQLVELLTELLEKDMRLRQVLACGALPLVQIGNGIETKRIDAELQPELEDFEQRVMDRGIIEIQIGLMRIEAMPVVRLGDRVPCPIRSLKVLEDDARVFEFIGRVAPQVVIAPRRSRFRAPRFLKPGMLIARVIDHQLGDHAQSTAMRLAKEDLEIAERTVARMNGRVISDVVTVVAKRRRVERQQPENVDTEILEVVEFPGETLEVTDAIRIRVKERFDVRLIDDPVLVPIVVRHFAGSSIRHPEPRRRRRISKSRVCILRSFGVFAPQDDGPVGRRSS